MVAHGRFQTGKGAIVHPGAGNGHIPQRRRAKSEHIPQIARFPRPAKVERPLVSLTRPDLGYGDIVKLEIAQQRPAVTLDAVGLAVKEACSFGG